MRDAVGGVVRVEYVNGVDASDGLVTLARTFDFQGLTIHTTPGYDNVTGLGTPNGLAFLLVSLIITESKRIDCAVRSGLFRSMLLCLVKGSSDISLGLISWVLSRNGV